MQEEPKNSNFLHPFSQAAWIAEDLDGIRRLKRPAAGCYESQSCTILILR